MIYTYVLYTFHLRTHRILTSIPKGFLNILNELLEVFSSKGLVAFCGDLNARCGYKNDFPSDNDYSERFISTLDNINNITEFNFPDRFTTDFTVNSSGAKLIDLCIHTGLKIANGRCGGRCR